MAALTKNAILVTVRARVKQTKICGHKGYKIQEHHTLKKL